MCNSKTDLGKDHFDTINLALFALLMKVGSVTNVDSAACAEKAGSIFTPDKAEDNMWQNILSMHQGQ